MKNTSITEAENTLPALIHEVESGNPIRLTRHGKAVAVLLSEDDYDRLIHPKKPDLFTAIASWRSQQDFSGEDEDESTDQWRDPSTGRNFSWES